METMTPALMPVAMLVTAGGRLLDESWPRWWETVDPETLDQTWPHLCVLGQLNDGNWWHGLERLFPELSFTGQLLAAAHAGFWVDDREQVGGQLSRFAERQYEELTVAWRAEIRRRRAGLN